MLINVNRKNMNKNKNKQKEIRDKNGFTLRQIKIFRESVADARNSNKQFDNGADLIADALK